MATASEKTQCMYWYAESGKSAVTVQRNYRRDYRKTPPSVNSIKNWREQFLKTNSVLDSKRSGRQSTSDDTEHCQSSGSHIGLNNYVVIMPIEYRCIKLNNNKVNSLQVYDIAQNCRILRSGGSAFVPNSLKISHYHHIKKLRPTK